jgi:putative component of membrane protein insertase Oxa1/YidC/SpoIIIJ protein YidD
MFPIRAQHAQTSHIPHSGNGITGEKSSKVLAWTILSFCFVKIYCAGNFAYIILRAVEAQGGISAASRVFSCNPEISGKIICTHAILIEPRMDGMQLIRIRMARKEGFWVWLRMRRNHPFRSRGIHQSRQARITNQRERSRPSPARISTSTGQREERRGGVTGGDACRESVPPVVVVATGDVARWPQVDRFIRLIAPSRWTEPAHVNLSPAFLFHSALANRICGPIGFLGRT